MTMQLFLTFLDHSCDPSQRAIPIRKLEQEYFKVIKCWQFSAMLYLTHYKYTQLGSHSPQRICSSWELANVHSLPPVLCLEHFYTAAYIRAGHEQMGGA